MLWLLDCVKSLGQWFTNGLDQWQGVGMFKGPEQPVDAKCRVLWAYHEGSELHSVCLASCTA